MIGEAKGVRRHRRTSRGFFQPGSGPIVSAAEPSDPAILNAPLFNYRLEGGKIGVVHHRRKVRLGFRGRVLTQVIFFPWKLVNGRPITATTVNLLLHRHGDALIIDADIVWPPVRPKNSIQAASHGLFLSSRAGGAGSAPNANQLPPTQSLARHSAEGPKREPHSKKPAAAFTANTRADEVIAGRLTLAATRSVAMAVSCASVLDTGSPRRSRDSRKCRLACCT